MKFLSAVAEFITSIKLAVVTILLLGVVSAVGTIVEARFDAEYAQKTVYQSWWMYAVMGLLCVNLIAVMVDRWPWKMRHSAFVMAHIGIILTLIGAIFTQRYGVDGTMAFKIGQEKSTITIKERDLVVYASFEGTEVRPIHQESAEFINDRPSEKNPRRISFGGQHIDVVEYQHLAFRTSEIIRSDRPADGPAVRIQLKNANVDVTEWLRRESGKSFQELNLGPATVVLSNGTYVPKEGINQIILSPGQSSKELRYAVYDKAGLLKKRGLVSESQTFDTGWMGLEFRVLRYHPKSFEKISYEKAEGSSPMAHSAIRFRYNGEDYWLGIGSLMRLYANDRMFIVAYVFRQMDLGFPLKLKEFKVGRYEGTKRAASYESLVTTHEGKDVVISMNEPLKQNGFTFYQSSFEEDEMGNPTMSILSVNHDPGRWVKYLGSLLIVLGSIALFYFKKVLNRPTKRQGASS